MATTWKRRRENTCTPEAGPASSAATEWILPADLVLEIAARSDARALLRCAAACRLLRLNVLDPSFIRRVSQEGGILPPCILTYLNTHNEMANPPSPLSLVHPSTSMSAYFLDIHMSPYMSRFADDLLAEYFPVASRGGLVLLQRRHASNKLCVYDIISGHRNFLSYPPCVDPNRGFGMCVLLTVADGIDNSFLLFVANLDDDYTSTIEVSTATSKCGTWAPAVTSHNNSGFSFQDWEPMYGNIVVLQGGVIHWLVRNRDKIVSYNVCRMEQTTIKVPEYVTNFKGQLYLGSYYSHDGQKLLRFLGIDMFKISVWHQLPRGYWDSEAVMIDMEEKLQSLDTDNGPSRPIFVKFKYIGEGSNTVLLHAFLWRPSKITTMLPVVLDLETKEMCVQRYPTPSSIVLEVDLPSRLRAMKRFP